MESSGDEETRSVRFEQVVRTCIEITAFHKQEAMRQQLTLLKRTERDIVRELEKRDRSCKEKEALARAESSSKAS